MFYHRNLLVAHMLSIIKYISAIVINEDVILDQRLNISDHNEEQHFNDIMCGQCVLPSF